MTTVKLVCENIMVGLRPVAGQIIVKAVRELKSGSVMIQTVAKEGLDNIRESKIERASRGRWSRAAKRLAAI